jgi:hypothetical protein
MNKILRYSFVALLAMMFAPSFAEDIIWQEDFSSYAADAVPAGGDYNYACENGGGTTKIYAANLAGGTAPELLVAKKQGSFSATIPLNGKSGEMMLTFLTNRNDLVVEITGATLGEKVRSGNADTYPVTVASGTASLTIKFYMSVNSNARLDNLKLYQGTAKKPAGLSWGTSARTVTLGASDNQFPQLSNENNLTVTYSSSKEEVATINAEGFVTLLTAGKTDITAEFAGNDEYEAAKVTYTLTVNEASTDVPELITVDQALAIIDTLGNGKTTTKVYQVEGFIVGTPDFQRKDDQTLYGNVNFDMAAEKNGTTKLTVFRAKSFENKNFTEETISLLKDGDKVVIEGKLQKYVKNEVVTPELTNGKLISVNGVGAGINNVKTDAAKNAIFNLQGQRVNNTAKGLFIVNGKKVVK